MRISDRSSDVCSSDLVGAAEPTVAEAQVTTGAEAAANKAIAEPLAASAATGALPDNTAKAARAPVTGGIPSWAIGRASCRDSVSKYVSNSGVAVVLKKTTNMHYPIYKPKRKRN